MVITLGLIWDPKAGSFKLKLNIGEDMLAHLLTKRAIFFRHGTNVWSSWICVTPDNMSETAVATSLERTNTIAEKYLSYRNELKYLPEFKI